jgi:DGQHR domain
VKKNEKPSFAAILVTQGKFRFYIAALPSETLSKTCFVVTRDEDPDEGFQRRLNPSRAEKIANYIDDNNGSIPTAIVVSAQPEAKLKYYSSTKTIKFDESQTAFLIIDGQHRVFGFKKARTPIRVPVVIYEGLNKQEETKLFLDINTTQEPVPDALIVDVQRLLGNETEKERICGDLFNKFFFDTSSILLGHLDRIGQTKGKISRVTFNRAVSNLLEIEMISSRDTDDKYKIINNYISGFDIALKGMNSKLEKAILRSTIFQAILSPNIYRIVAEKAINIHKGKFTPRFISEVLKPLKANLPLDTLLQPGNSVKKLEGRLLDALTKIDSNPPLILE